MYFADFIMGSFIGIAVMTCLLMLVILLALRRKKRPVTVESESPAVLPGSEKESVSFFITRREIAEDTRNLRNPDITVEERPDQPQLPTTLRYKGRTYAMLYGTDKGVLMTVRITDSCADKLSGKYPGIKPARFPKGPNWYRIPIEGAFSDKEEIYRILFEARVFLSLLKAQSRPVRA